MIVCVLCVLDMIFEYIQKRYTNSNIFNKCISLYSFAEDEGSRIKGRRLTIPDVIGNGLKWKPFNGSWINGNNVNKMYRL